MKSTQEWWQSLYASAMPISYILRQQIADQWLRIHSLPESKRHVETPEEESILLTRRNTVATDILGSEARCLLFAWRYSQPSGATPVTLPLADGAFVHVMEPDAIGTPDFVTIWCAPVIWSPGRFDSIIKSVANFKETDLLFASVETGEAYAPYDGGADLFLSSATRRDLLKQ